MVENLDAYRVADKAKAAFEQDESDAAGNKMLEEVNAELKTLSKPEQDLVAKELYQEGLLPNIALDRGIVGNLRDVTRDELSAIANREGTTSVTGMAAQFLVDNFAAVSRYGWTSDDISRSNVKDFDSDTDTQLDAVQVNRELNGLIQLNKQQLPDDVDVQAREGMTGDDIDRLLANPDQLTREQARALNIMKDNYNDLSAGWGEISSSSMTIYNSFVFPNSDFPEFKDGAMGPVDPSLVESAKAEQARRQSAASELSTDNQVTDASSDSSRNDSESVQVAASINDFSIFQTIRESSRPNTPDGKLNNDRKAPIEPQIPDKKKLSAVNSESEESLTPKETMITRFPGVTELLDCFTPSNRKNEGGITSNGGRLPEKPVNSKAEESATRASESTKAEIRDDRGLISTPFIPFKEKEMSVEQGDNLWRIARKHLTESTGRRASNDEISHFVDEIVKRNKIQNPNAIRPNQILVMPMDESAQYLTNLAILR